MANVKISELPVATSLNGADSFPVVQGGVTKQVTRSILLDAVYPVGSIYINATSATNPNTLLGFGTWVAFGAGRVPVGFDAGNALFDTAEETGGSADAVVVSHMHTATTSITDPGHLHSVNTYQGNSGSGVANTGVDSGPFVIPSGTVSSVTGITASTTVASFGTSGTNANYQPYITVYMWKRTA